MIGRVDFESTNAPKFLSQLISCINDMTSDRLRVATAAIFGPNRLELTFPKSYHVHMQYCERPEVRNRLESVATEIAGRQVSISLQLSREEPQKQQSVEPAAQARPTSRAAGPNDGQNDEFVQQAQSIFGATVQRVDRLPNGRT